MDSHMYSIAHQDLLLNHATRPRRFETRDGLTIFVICLKSETCSRESQEKVQ